MKIFIMTRKTTSKSDLEIIESIVECYEYSLNLLQPILKLNNLYIMLTNLDVRVNNSQIYRIEHRKRTMIKINFEEIVDDYINKDWKHRYSKKYLPKKLDTVDHSLFILFHEIAHYLNKDHLLNWGKLSQMELALKETERDIEALNYLKLVHKLEKINES